MDQIVGDAGVLRLPLPDRLQDRGALELVGVGLVGGRRRHVQGDGIENLRLVVVGIFCRQRLHLLQVGLHPRRLRGLVVVNIHHRQRVDVVALALGLGASGLCLLDRRKPERKIGRRYRAVRIVEQRQRDTPIGDGAFRIGLDRLPRRFPLIPHTRTSAGIASRDQTAVAPSRCTMSRNAPCPVSGRRLPAPDPVRKFQAPPRPQWSPQKEIHA